jgi:alpha-ketoglutarate-dependent taurine dioxygenase
MRAMLYGSIPSVNTQLQLVTQTVRMTKKWQSAVRLVQLEHVMVKIGNTAEVPTNDQLHWDTMFRNQVVGWEAFRTNADKAEEL